MKGNEQDANDALYSKYSVPIVVCKWYLSTSSSPAAALAR